MSQGGSGQYDPPGSGELDRAHAVGRALLSAIPWAGGAAVELFNQLVRPPLDRRQHIWMESVAIGLEGLEGRVASIEGLAANDVFVDTLLQASQAAILTSDREKLDALRNAVLNSALPEAPEPAMQQLFIQVVREFTVWHIRMLQLLRTGTFWEPSRNAYDTPNMPTIARSLLGMPLRGSPAPDTRAQEFFASTWRGLHMYALVSVDVSKGSVSVAPPIVGRDRAYAKTSELGEEFLRFISEPSGAQVTGQPGRQP